jgi:hypothetical protein
MREREKERERESTQESVIFFDKFSSFWEKKEKYIHIHILLQIPCFLKKYSPKKRRSNSPKIPINLPQLPTT